MTTKHVRPEAGHGAWDGVDVLRYKAEGSAPFKDVTRQILFDDPTQRCQLRYFEVGTDGYSTLERHEHTHAVVILHGYGRCFVGDRVYEVGEHDLVHIPPLTWHQFRADAGMPLGFLCMVTAERDRPQLPTEEDLRELRKHQAVAAFIAT